jgi:two-component system alkaline phosphatase synthesis response regulator PhoP
VSDAPVLIIDDDPVSAELTQRRLVRAGIEAEVCIGGAGSLKRFAEGEFRVVVLDVDMPGINGTQLIQGFWERAESQRPQVLLYSNLDTEALSEAARRHGAQAFLTKSESKEALVAKVRDLLGPA